MDNQPDLGTLRSAIELACRAPSVHNTQPWRWLLGERSIHLMADRTRQVSAADPDGRDLLISCGAALHHLRVALGGLGWSATVQYLPNPSDPEHLAAVTVHPSTPEPDAAELGAVELGAVELGAVEASAVELSAAVTRRRCDRRPSASWPVPAQHLDLLTAIAQRTAPVRVVPVRDERTRAELARAMADASVRQAADPGYRSELAVWSGRSHAAVDGVLADSAPAGPVVYGDTVMRSFAQGAMPVAQPVAGEDDMGELLLITTATDEPRDRVHAGEAASAIMLTATTLNLATCPLSQVTEVPESGAALADRVLHGDAVAQLVMRVAWVPDAADPMPRTPRRPLDEVIGFLPGVGQDPRRTQPWRPAVEVASSVGTAHGVES